MGQLNAGSTKRQSWWPRSLYLIPAIITIVMLMVSLTGAADDFNLPFLLQVPIPLIEIIGSAVLFWLSHQRKAQSFGYVLAASLVPCFLAPLALLYPWTVAPSHLGGIGWGGAGFFLHWLTKYPDFGPVNIEVLVGIAAILCLGFLPVIFGVLALGKYRLMLLSSLACVIWIAYLPIIIRLDSDLVLAALYGSAGQSLLFLSYGPIIRLLAAVAVLVSLFFYRKRA
jgi:hypothetical protein